MNEQTKKGRNQNSFQVTDDRSEGEQEDRPAQASTQRERSNHMHRSRSGLSRSNPGFDPKVEDSQEPQSGVALGHLEKPHHPRAQTYICGLLRRYLI